MPPYNPVPNRCLASTGGVKAADPVTRGPGESKREGSSSAIRAARRRHPSGLRVQGARRLVVNDEGLKVPRVGNCASAPDARPQAFRHTMAISMLGRGADISLSQDLLGHSSLSSTQIYTHVSTERLRAAFKQAHPRA